jgi:hypothetical protein
MVKVKSRTLHETDLSNGRTRRALLRIQMDLLERDDLGGCSGAALGEASDPFFGRS